MKLFINLFFLIIFSNAAGQSKFEPRSFSLSNGLKVVILENKRAPVVAQMIWYDFGSGVESKGKSGLAHFMEHLMFKGTKKFPENYYSDFLSRIGGSENAFTSYDYTAYYQIFPSSEIAKVLSMEADRMTNLTLSKKNVEVEKQVILEERFQRIESDPSAKLDESMRSILFPNNYYGRPIIGWKHEIEKLKIDDVIEFYKKYYIPNNATLVLSGDVDFDKAKKLVKKYFGRIKKGKKIENNELKDPNLNTNVFVKMSHPTVKQRIWKKFYRTSSYISNIDNSVALDIGMKILASGSSSLLYQELVNKKKKFSVIGAYYQGLTKGEGNIYFYAIPVEGVNTADIDKIIMDEIKNILDVGLQKKRFEIEKKKYFFDMIYQRDGILNPAQIYGEALTIGMSLEDIKTWNKKIKQIEIEDVHKALKNFLNNQNYVIGELKN
jgi:zinc protease